MAKKASGTKAATKKTAAKKPAAKKPAAKKPAAKKTTTKKPATKTPTTKAAAKKPAAKKPAAKKPAVKKKPAMKKAPAAKAAAPKKAGKRKVDAHCSLSGAEVHEDFDAMLNQTNINANNNKFYVIQLLTQGGKFYVWNRWGRVSERGQSALKGPFDLAGATREFEAKFKSKSANKWESRADFVPKKGKYSLIEIEASEDDEVEELDQKLRDLDAKRGKIEEPQKFKDCGLVKPLQSFIDLIFDHDMFKGAMADFDIDVKKMPLGKLSKAQVQKGFDVLEELQQALSKSRSNTVINDLSSQFYTVIPHSFGRRIPPPIDTGEKLQSKKDMLNVLSDIDVALGLQKKTTVKSSAKLAEHPLDRNYRELKCKLSWLDPKSDMYKVILNYLEATRGSWAKHSIIDVFEVDRDGTDARFKAHDALDNRRLLWHGTNVAVVAAILKGGLRIMPHSGGRVGKGIYLASEQSKSAGYVGRSRNTGIMFLAEAALGKEHHISRDDWRLKAAPKGYHSIIAKGHTEPDPSKDITMTIGGREVVVPQGKPIKQKQWSKSSFSQSEYLVYKESQVRLRYVLKMRM